MDLPRSVAVVGLLLVVKTLGPGSFPRILPVLPTVSRRLPFLLNQKSFSGASSASFVPSPFLCHFLFFYPLFFLISCSFYAESPH